MRLSIQGDAVVNPIDGYLENRAGSDFDLKCGELIQALTPAHFRPSPCSGGDRSRLDQYVMQGHFSFSNHLSKSNRKEGGQLSDSFFVR